MSAPCSPSESCPALSRCRASPPTSTGVPTSTRRSRTNGYAKRSENFAPGCDITPATTVPRIHVDLHERDSSECPDEPLLTYLRARLQRADVAYLQRRYPSVGPPTPKSPSVPLPRGKISPRMFRAHVYEISRLGRREDDSSHQDETSTHEARNGRERNFFGAAYILLHSKPLYRRTPGGGCQVQPACCPMSLP